MKLHDQHMHSSFSQDSTEDLREYYIKASKEGVKYVCTCEHYDFYTVFDGSTWSVDYEALIAYQKKLHEEFPTVTPLLGLELGYKKRCLKEMNEIASKYDFDIIQLSIHDNDKWDYYFADAFEIGIVLSMNEYFDLMIESLNTYDNYDVLSHIDFAFKTAKSLDKTLNFSLFEEKIIEVMKLVIKKKKSLEINGKIQEIVNDGSDSHLKYILDLYKSLGGEKLTLSSDAHEANKYRRHFSHLMKVIKSCGFHELRYYIKRREYIYIIGDDYG